MARRINAKIDEYQDREGNTKGKYVEIGAIVSNANGEYIILNPTVDLAGVMIKQRLLGQKNGKGAYDSVMCSIFDNSQSGNQNNQQSQGQGQTQGQGRPNQQQKQTGYNNNFDDDIPF